MPTRTRALLINPPTGLYVREDRCQAPVEGMAATMARPPLDLAYMAASLEQAGITCTIRDYPVLGATWTSFRDDLTALKPDLLIVSVTSFTIHDDLTACRIAREALGEAILTVAKGAHISVKADEVLADAPALDVAIRGEYEVVVREIAVAGDLRTVRGVTFRDRRTGVIVATEDRPFLDDLDSLPFPARHLLDNALYRRPDTGEPQTTVQTCRGCPSGCIFCLAPTVYGARLRTRSPQNVVAELEECVARYGIRDFFFRADTFTLNKAWTIAVCQAILERGLKVRWVCNSRVDTIDAERLGWMRKAGCHGIAFGIESGSQEILDKMKKGITLERAREAVALCRKSGMTTLLYFVVGLPWETRAHVLQSVEFARSLRGDFVEFHLAIPFPGTVLHDLAMKDGLLNQEALDGYDYSRSPLRTYTLSAEDLLALRREALRRVYLDPRGLWRAAWAALSGIRSPIQFVRALGYGIAKLASLVGPHRNHA